MWSTPKTILNCRDWLYWMWYIMKTRKNNDMIDCIGVVYTKNKIELSWLIGQGAVYDKKQTGKIYGRLYRCNLHRKRNWVVVINCTRWDLWLKLDRTIMWLIVVVWFTPKSKLSYRDLLNRVHSVTKTR